MTAVRSFPPIASASARVLILGSMPGVASLDAGEYYAHPRNAFWDIVCEILRIDRALPYAARAATVAERGIAIWDVLASCEREGSLDSAIDDTSIVVNDFESFLASHDMISCVLFNGGKAEAAYRRHVLPTLATRRAVEYRRLPSTSPAHASMSRAEKLRVWHAAITDSGLVVGSRA